MARVSIIVPVYNKAEYLSACLDSILAQTLDDIEVICVDNNSTDNSPSILDQKAEQDKRVKVIMETQQGPSHARNAGLAAATGEFVGFIDADDFIEPDYYERLLAACDKHAADIALCGFDHYHPSTDTLGQPVLPSSGPSFIPREMGGSVFSTTTPSVCTKLFRRSLIQREGISFNTELAIAEDALFSYEVIMRAAAVGVIAEPLYHYRQEVPGQLTGSASNSGIQIFEAFRLLDEKIASMDNGDAFLEGLLNYSCDGTRYALYIAQTFPAYEEIFNAFKADWAPRLAQLPEGALYPELADFWELFRKADRAADLLHGQWHQTDSYLQLREGQMGRLEQARSELERDRNRLREERRLLEEERNRLADERNRLERERDELERDRNRLAAELEELKESTMLRVGKAVTAVPRAIKDAFRGRSS